ncbi:Hypothetical protein D9617_49g041250 [Elsinoe fawcettii]|nr:Hypothetical protein D9617_49g041250 [Elsinoe fawcettii]
MAMEEDIARVQEPSSGRADKVLEMIVGESRDNLIEPSFGPLMNRW